MANRLEALSIRRLLTILWSYNRLFFITSLIIVIVFTSVFFLVNTFGPVSKKYSLQFTFEFPGLENNKYPNGTDFSPFDILSKANLRTAFDTSGLAEFMSFAEFENSLSLTPVSWELEEIEMKFLEDVSERRLSYEERVSIRREYEQDIANLGPISEYRLMLILDNRIAVPNDLCEVALTKVLQAWAEDAYIRLGVLKYDIPYVSEKGLDVSYVKDPVELIQSIDFLRIQAGRLDSIIGQMRKVPGSSSVRSEQDNLSLVELDYRLSDLLSQRVIPFVSRLVSYGPISQPEKVQAYLASRIKESQDSLDRARERRAGLLESYRAYTRAEVSMPNLSGEQAGETPTETRAETVTPAMMAQLDSSFINQLVTIISSNMDVEFRQSLTERIIAEGFIAADAQREVNLYQSWRDSLAGQRNSSPSVAPEASAEYQSILNELRQIININCEFYDLLSLNHVAPGSYLYQLNRPAVLTRLEPLEPRSVTILAVFSIIFVFLLLAVVALVRYRKSSE